MPVPERPFANLDKQIAGVVDRRHTNCGLQHGGRQFRGLLFCVPATVCPSNGGNPARTVGTVGQELRSVSR